MIILGISAYYHDSAAALLINGEIVSASCEERFTRIKHDKSFPKLAIQYCMSEARINYKDLDYIVFYEKPFIKFERIITTHIQYAPKGFHTFIKSLPIWLKERVNMKRTIEKELNRLFQCKEKWNVRFVEHHMSHAAFAYYNSSHKDAAILVVDAVGEMATTSIMKGMNGNISLIKQQFFPHSLGLLYSSFTYFLGFTVNSDEYKVMGLAPYGDLKDNQTQSFIKIIKKELVNVDDSGSIKINEEYFSFMYGLKMINEKKWERLFGIKKRKTNDKINQSHMNLAMAIQKITEDILLNLAKHVKEITNSNHLCISGGCALNCSAMGKIKASKIFDSISIPFAPGDDGGAIGATLYLYSLLNCNIRAIVTPYLGPKYTNDEIINILKNQTLKFTMLSDSELYEKVSKHISERKIVGWFQDKMEFGPRALGNRSILADPRNAKMKNIINAKVKFRESFRPFAPIVIKEDASRYFSDNDSPYMMFTAKVVKDCNNIPAVTHLDRTSRVQTVTKEQNEQIYSLLQVFKSKTGCSVLLNTSFNIMGEPIVCSPYDAVKTYIKSGIDILVINQFLIVK